MRAVLAIAFLLVFIVRTPKVLSSPKGRASWLACGFGGLGFLISDSFVPYTTVDSWLGGSNLTHLLRNLLLTTALWFLRQAVMQTIPARHKLNDAWKYSLYTLICGLAAIAVPFLIADTSGTSDSFMTERGSQPGVYIYAFVYMAFVALMGLDLVWALRGKWIGCLGLIRAGSFLIFASSVDEMLYITAVFTHTGSEGFLTFTRSAFSVIYVGVALIVVSLCIMAFHPLQRLTTAALQSLIRYHQNKIPGDANDQSPEQPALSTPRSKMYRSLILLHDLETQHKVTYGRFAQLMIAGARRQLSGNVGR